MSSIPGLRPREVIAILAELGSQEVRHHGSHKRFARADGRSTTVPVHGSRDNHPDLLRLIAHDTGLTVRQFIALR